MKFESHHHHLDLFSPALFRGKDLNFGTWLKKNAKLKLVPNQEKKLSIPSSPTSDFPAFCAPLSVKVISDDEPVPPPPVLSNGGCHVSTLSHNESRRQNKSLGMKVFSLGFLPIKSALERKTSYNLNRFRSIFGCLLLLLFVKQWKLAVLVSRSAQKSSSSSSSSVACHQEVGLLGGSCCFSFLLVIYAVLQRRARIFFLREGKTKDGRLGSMTFTKCFC